MVKIVKVISAVIAITALFWLAYPLINSAELTAWVERAGAWGPVVLIGYVIASHVLAPLAGIPAIVVGSAVFGVPQTMAYLYISGLISAPINFFISRTLGRTWVLRFVSAPTMQTIDKIVNSSGLALLVAARVFGGALFEEISYAFGLTSMRFKTFFIATALGSAVPLAALGFFFRGTDFTSVWNTGLFVGAVLLSLALFGIFFAVRTHSRTEATRAQ